MIRKIPLSEHYYKEEEIDAFLNNKSDKNHEHGNVTNDGKVTTDTSSVNKVVVTDSSNSIKTINKLPLDKVTHQDISGKVNVNDIQDNFSSTESAKPLSANKGKELKDLVDTKANSDNVYTKTQTLTTSEINQAIADGVGNVEIFEIVQELPTTNIKGNKFYLTPNGENIEKNVYDINIYINNNWETIDSLEFDIGNYPTTSEVNVLLNGKVDKIDGKQLSKNDFTDALKSKLENDVLTEHQSLVNYIQKSQTEGLVKNDGSIDTNQYLTEHQSLTNYIQKSQTQGLVKNDGTIDTNQYLTQHQSLTNYVQKSQVPGLIKNDGTIDSNQYLTEHQSLTNYVQKSLTSGLVKNDGTIDTNEYVTKETVPKSFNHGFIDSNLVLHLIYLGTEIFVTKTIMQSGDNNPITVVVTDDEGNLLEGMPVEFYINGVKVGQTTNTNSNGVATYTYQGIGSGEIEVQVKIDSFVSETLNVWDTLKYDNGTINSHNDIWDYDSTKTVLTRYDEYSSITEKVSGTDARMYCKNLPTSATIDIELCQMDGDVSQGGLNFYSDYAYINYFALANLGYTSSILGQWVRLRVSYGNGSFTVTSLDDPTKTITKQYTGDITSFSPSTNATITEHRFRNMKVYSI